MDLLIIRHAIAADRDAWAARGHDDDLRPLTPDGRRKMKRGARGLARIADAPDVLVTSPLTRARQTAAIVADAWRLPAAAVHDALRPTVRPARTLAWLESLEAETVAFVGHEPHLGALVSLALGVTGAKGEVRTPLRKGGVVRLRFEGKTAAGRGTLVWALPPRVLRALAG